jgi:hypothetical protein
MKDKTEEELNKLQNRLWDRSDAPRLTPEQLNAIDLLILGKTDKETAELVGVRRETITKWHKNPFFIAELNVKREALWADAKLRLQGLAYEAVNVLTNGLHSSDEKIAIAAAVHILKVTGLYDVKGNDVRHVPKTAEEAVWAQTVKEKTYYYRASRPDALTDFSTRNWAEEVGTQYAAKMMDIEYEQAVDEQKKELREYKKRTKIQPLPPQVEPIPPTIEIIKENPQQETLELIEA